MIRVFIRRIFTVDSVNSTESTRPTAASQLSFWVSGSGRQFGSGQPVLVGLGSGSDPHESTRLTRSTHSTFQHEDLVKIIGVFNI
ncbi:hypothetical protein HanXRQr2_Chr12g0556881 [Helianthus annuus]|uniref:Uncharacterized protein n=1 Tax=Helianthus annuus TaxID=4232 RepID=A0A9K3MXD7_HELAN|nr:hypothetical protein HanXRQr2_Chr12g0556881 [Helianthus annuus]KAJ0506439.1 hypothetical protein HanHA89_Chr12g0481981 [Helianthus annuus]KAJ0676115.1 hypothetical protein HanLR1_Chr12g0458961 [Helianthus annuus]KAJ0679350.1 hypothetical protein HanOQP8_Chr12g0458401 [Helianthus annuus]KAJ0863961.1 hypothetical protein HanPSC8_Chr12g0536131 [Helianthus annuus]